jgi:tRNA A-37 threonylcarbamoyl transferase component Bud32
MSAEPGDEAQAANTRPLEQQPDPTGCLSEETVWQYVAGTQEGETDVVVRRHLDRCRSCCVIVAEAARALVDREHTNASSSSQPTGRPEVLTFSPGQVIAERYRVIRFVAKGGMGEVYEVHDSVLDETIALKTLVSTALDDAAAMNRFISEVRAARQVTHPNVCRILEFGFHRDPSGAAGQAEQVPFLIMEFLHGETLDRRISRLGRLSGAEVRALLPQITAGLRAIHAAGIVHRDIKPHNIVLLAGTSERLVLTDFGVARSIDPDRARSSTAGTFVAGTLDYMSPEQMEGKPPTVSFDIYSVGVVLFEMLTGRKPWSGNSAISAAVERFHRAAPKPSDIVSELAPWDEVVGRCLARQPEDRFKSVEEIVPPTPAPVPAARRGVRKKVVWTGAALAAAVAAAVAATGVGRRDPDPTAAVPVAAPELAETLSRRPWGAPPPRQARRVFASTGCSHDMVSIAGRFCIDRFEASTIDDVEERHLSPFYPPWAPLARSVHAYWAERLRQGKEGADASLPRLQDFERRDAWRPRAMSTAAVTPQGYVSRPVAAAACASAGKRLCTEAEWTTACRGEKNTRFPYGDKFVGGLCNIRKDTNPPAFSDGAVADPLNDPRLNRVGTGQARYLHKTGDDWRCKSSWGPDAAYDMVGNLAEWVDGPQAVLVGGHFTRDAASGCEHRNTEHAEAGPGYYENSIGFRCCDDPRPRAATPTPPFQVKLEAGDVWGPASDHDGFVSESGVATDVFAGKPVLFRGHVHGGPQDQLPGGAPYLVYRFRLTFPQPVRIAAISIHGAGSQREESQMRLLDGHGKLLGSRKHTSGYKVTVTSILEPANAIGTEFLLEEYDYAGRYRFRSRIEVTAHPIR